MADARDGRVLPADEKSHHKAHWKNEFTEGYIMKTSIGPNDFFKEIRDAMDAIAETGNSSLPPSSLLAELGLDKIPIIPHSDQKLMRSGLVMRNTKGVSFMFQAGTIFGLTLYVGLVYSNDPEAQHRPYLAFYTGNGNTSTTAVRNSAFLIEQLREAARIGHKCLSTVVKAALIGNGAIEGRKFILTYSEIISLNKLCMKRPAWNFGKQTMVPAPKQEQTSTKFSAGNASNSFHQDSVVIQKNDQVLPRREFKSSGLSDATHEHGASPRTIKRSDSRENSLSVLSSNSQKSETAQSISDPSEFLSIDAAIREDEKAGHSEVQEAKAKLERLSRQKEKLERSMARANEKKRVGQDKIQKAERWRKDSMARLTPNLRAFWEAASKAEKRSDAS